jgi:hypothetical protein
VESSPSASKDTVFVGSADGSLYALYATTGVLKWKAEVGDSVKSSPTVAGGHVFVGASTQRGGQVTALNEQTGQRQWFFRTDGWVTGKVGARASAPSTSGALVARWGHRMPPPYGICLSFHPRRFRFQAAATRPSKPDNDASPSTYQEGVGARRGSH